MFAVAACGGSAPPPAAPVEPPVDERAAEKDAKGLVAEIYKTINRNKTDSLFSLVADPVIVFGPRLRDASIKREDALVALGGVIRAKQPKGGKPARTLVRSGGLSVVVSPGGHSAWAFDVIDVDGQPLAFTAVLTNANDLWAVSAVNIAATPAGRVVKTESARDAIVPPGATAVAHADPAAAAAVDKLTRGLLDQSWGDELASRSDALVAGPTAGDVARGKKPIKKLWSARLKANVREAVSGDVSSAVTPDGELAWASMPVTRVADGEPALPLRLFAVFEKDAGTWKLIALHEAVAVDEPGSGAPFKKIVPPAPEPTKAAASDKPADSADSKTRSRKTKPKPTSE